MTAQPLWLRFLFQDCPDLLNFSLATKDNKAEEDRGARRDV
jgi:hypothetical protein